MFGKRLKELRQQHEMTQQELAKILNVSTSAISHYEKETREPSEHIIVTVANSFNVSCDYLLGMEDTPKKADYSEELSEIYRKLETIDKLIDDLRQR